MEIKTLTSGKTMTVREVSDVLGLDPRTIQIKVKELFPNIVKERETTYLTESQVTAVKLACEKKFAVKTDLEKELLIQQAMMFQAEKIQAMQAEIEVMKPKAELADMAIRDDTTQYSITDAGKHLGIRQSEMFSLLREKRLLTLKNLPTQRAKDYNVLSIRSNLVGDKLRPQAVMTMENIYNFKERYCK